jgi:hypothetical protein
MRVNKRGKNISGREQKNEQGIVILLVAVFMLFVVGAMAALAIDVVTLYTARSEAQLAADAGALAGARVLANSGMTSDITGGLTLNAEPIASQVATQVATHNDVGGTRLVNAQVTVTFTNDAAPPYNPRVTVQVQVTTLPTFFSRIWGNQQLAVAASATAEAYNASGAFAIGPGPPVAPICVKPWLLPNIDPTQTNSTVKIFQATGTASPGLLGQTWPNATVANPNPNGLYSACAGDCSLGISMPAAGQYYPGAIDATDFPAPTALPSCAAGFNDYQKAVAGCVQRPISCGTVSAINPSAINIDQNNYTAGTRDSDTVQAVGCLIHYNVPGGVLGDADSIDFADTPSTPYEFLGGNQNPVAGAQGWPINVSDSLVTIPVIDTTTSAPANPATVIGFLQVFLNPQQSVQPFPLTTPPATVVNPQIPAMIINAVGCEGTSAGTAPILGNGASPVAVRLITPP